MARLTKKQLLVDLEFLHEHAARWKGYYTGHPVDEDDEDSPDEGDAFEAECNIALSRLREFIEEGRLPKRAPKGRKPRGRHVPKLESNPFERDGDQLMNAVADWDGRIRE